MTDDDDIGNFLDAQDRALAVHEAGHAVVASALGADVVLVEIDIRTGNGGSRSSTFADGDVKNLAVCVAGCRAEHAFDAPALRSTKKGDFRLMRALLSHFPEPDRRAARAEGYRLADEKLKANAGIVSRIADALLRGGSRTRHASKAKSWLRCSQEAANFHCSCLVWFLVITAYPRSAP